VPGRRGEEPPHRRHCQARVVAVLCPPLERPLRRGEARPHLG
jgi:hypothetical protein